MAISAVVFCLFVFVQIVVAAPSNEPCDLPQDLQREIASKYPGAKVVTLADLDEDDRGFFQKDHDNGCPGLVKVDFYGDGKPTLAVVLITKDSKGNQDTELIVAHRVGERWRTTMLDMGGPYAPVIWSQAPGEYQDIYLISKRIRATRPVIVFCKYESWTTLYAWTGKKVTKIWLADYRRSFPQVR